MDLDSLLESLTEEQVTVITEAISAETEVGKAKYRSKDKEVLKFKTALKEMGYDNSSEKLEEFIEKKKAVAEPVEPSLSDKALKSELDALKADLAKEKADAKKANLFNKLQAELGDKLIGSKLIIEDAIRNDRFDLDGDTLVYKDGEDVLNASKGFEAIKEENSSAITTNQTGGTGSVGGDGSSEPEAGESLEDIIAFLTSDN